MSDPEDLVATAYIEACLAELDAPKPGNVHRFAPGHRMEVEDFVRSAEASAAPIASRGDRVGTRVRAAVDATLKAVGQNTNLGIILLCAPLAAAVEIQDTPLRPSLAWVLDRLDLSDAADVFSAIAAANPGGLGRAPRHDVNAPPTVTLREAMAEAAGRDRIARQYITSYEDIFSLGLPALAAGRRWHADARWSTLAVYLTFLAALPDTHIVRKFDMLRPPRCSPRGRRLARRVRCGSRSGGDLRRLARLGCGAQIARDQPRNERGSHCRDLVRVLSRASTTTNALPPSCPYALTMLELGLRGSRPSTIRPTDPASAGC